MRCRLLVHFPAKMPFLLLTQRRLRQPHVASFRFLTAGTHCGNCAGRCLKSLYRGRFCPSARGGVGTMVWTSRKKPARNPTSAATNGGFRSCPPATLKKGDRNVQSEPESRPAEPESGTEAGSTAGRRAETRTAAAGSEPPGSEARPARPAGQGSVTPRPLEVGRIVDELKERSRQGGAFLFGMLAQPGTSLRGHLDLSWNLN